MCNNSHIKTTNIGLNNCLWSICGIKIVDGKEEYIEENFKHQGNNYNYFNGKNSNKWKVLLFSVFS